MHGIKLGQAFGRKVQEIPAYDELHHPKKALGQCMTLVGKDGPNRTCEAEQSGHVSEKINLLFCSLFSLSCSNGRQHLCPSDVWTTIPK